MNFSEAVKKSHDTGGREMRRRTLPEGLTFHVKHGMVLIGDGTTEYSSYCGFLATDWEIVPEPPKNMTFLEAMAKVRKGEKVCRECWSNAYVGHGIGSLYTTIIKNEANVEYRRYFTPSLSDIEATDWIVVDEPTT